MTIINIRGTSGSGKSTLVHRLINETFELATIKRQYSTWKEPKIVAYELVAGKPTFIVGKYETQCGGCDAMSYKGSHDDIEALVREFLPQGNVIFEGLTISSTLTRWRRISDENPGEFIWAFMDTPEEVCHQRILARSGREPKRDAKGLADYNKKWRGCMRHAVELQEQGQRVEMLSSDDAGYEKFLELLFT